MTEQTTLTLVWRQDLEAAGFPANMIDADIGERLAQAPSAVDELLAAIDAQLVAEPYSREWRAALDQTNRAFVKLGRWRWDLPVGEA